MSLKGLIIKYFILNLKCIKYIARFNSIINIFIIITIIMNKLNYDLDLYRRLQKQLESNEQLLIPDS